MPARTKARAGTEPAPAANGGRVHVGRQPIHALDLSLYGYELLFRDAPGALSAQVEDADAATTSTILAAFAEFDLTELLGGRPGFINLTRAFLTGQLPVPFAPDAAVLEVLETVEIDAEVVAGATRLVERGYRLAMDDFIWHPAAEALLPIAQIVKIDVLGQSWAEVMATVERCRPHGVTLLAERVEDEAMMARCRAEGFTLFQGYHLGRPQVLSADTLSPAHALAVQLVGKLSDPDTTARDVEEMLRVDPGLTYKLLRIANSADAAQRRPVSSIRDAVVLVGLARLRSWLVLLALDGLPGGYEQIGESLTRARTCEEVARRLGAADPDSAFTLGLLHSIKSMLGIEDAELRERLPRLSPELDGALAGRPSRLRSILDAVLLYEGAFAPEGEVRDTVPEQPARRLDPAAVRAQVEIPAQVISATYLSALAWTSRTLSQLNPGGQFDNTK